VASEAVQEVLEAFETDTFDLSQLVYIEYELGVFG
jgi:hypothetical protein